MNELIQTYKKQIDDALNGRTEVKGSPASVYIAVLSSVINDMEKLKDKQNEN